ncbi:MAG: hypothetical protein KTR31_17840 [Myxococcales bacterium]|nr:hypothetical protein [Myxococcales bacterium]
MLTLAFVVLSMLQAHAGPRDDPAEEIIVYADDFARWDDTRWLVQNELVLPMGVTLARDQNEAFRTYAMQIRAILVCSKEHKLSKKKWEVECEIEDVGLLATSMRRFRRQRDREVVQRVLDEIDSKITGMRIQMQTDFKGGITNVDLEGIDTRNVRERSIQETLRQVVSRMTAGFHLRIPDHAQREGQWVEYRSALMQMPSLTASRGSTTMVHLVTPRTGMQIVQTVGEGTTTVFLPQTRPDFLEASTATTDAARSSDPDDQIERVEGTSNIGLTQQTESEVEAIYSMKATGVAIFERANGIMAERVWVVHGTPTASSTLGVQTGPFRNAGRITMLGENDRPTVGQTAQVAPPGRGIEGLVPWVSIETLE